MHYALFEFLCERGERTGGGCNLRVRGCLFLGKRGDIGCLLMDDVRDLVEFFDGCHRTLRTRARLLTCDGDLFDLGGQALDECGDGVELAARLLDLCDIFLDLCLLLLREVECRLNLRGVVADDATNLLGGRLGLLRELADFLGNDGSAR